MKTAVAVVGGGPAGTTAAAYLRRAGVDVTIVEKAEFPRFRVGEAMTGEAGGVLRDLGLESAMDQHGFAVKNAGVVIGPSGSNAFTVPAMRRDPDGLTPITTWQVKRSSFDQMLLENASRQGASVVRGRATAPIVEDGIVRGVELELDGGRRDVLHADVVVDASGPATFLSRTGIAGPKERGRYSHQMAVYAHFEGARFADELGSRNTHIYYQRTFHWSWFIPMGADTVSIGVVIPSEYFRERGESTEAFLTRELRELNPGLEARSRGLTRVSDVHAVSNFSYHIKRFVGPGYLAVGDAHRFVDPIFAYGVHLALVEGRMAAHAVVEHLEAGSFAAPDAFAEYQRTCELGTDNIQALVDCFWNNPLAFSVFVHRRYRDDFIDLFAGRVYQEHPSPGLQAIHRVNALGAVLPASSAAA
jgi:1H-pyrrole-2-carbonyl-[peptidyl-carrier protein] brominase